jgi:hypothetical protein
LSPGETISRKFVFYVPRDTYDAVEVDIALPSSKERQKNAWYGKWFGHTNEPAAGIKYSLQLDGRGYVYSIYRIRPDGTTEPLGRNSEGNYKPRDLYELGYANFGSWNTISLWDSNAVPAPVAAASPTN